MQSIYRCRAYLFISLFFFSQGCISDKAPQETTLMLVWPEAYSGEEWQSVKTGLSWSLSFLGARLPAGSTDRVFKRHGSSMIELDAGKAGFDDHTMKSLVTIFRQIRESDEYKKTGGIDLGRFLVLTVYSSWNYYGLTRAESSLEEFRNKYNTDDCLKFALTNSTISKGDRLITFRISGDVEDIFFLAEEGTGSIEEGTFITSEYEVITFMPNSQPRFALYDVMGKLKDAADTSLTLAGKPGKCMWCHESKIQPLFSVATDVTGYLTQMEYSQKVDSANLKLKQYRGSLDTEINYSNLEDHAFSELLYTSFMEPLIFRLANEWNMSETDVAAIISSLPVHSNPEFPVAGNLYLRSDLEPFAPFRSLPVPAFVREKSSYEPDFLNMRPH